jgi:hypothetical protein
MTMPSISDLFQMAPDAVAERIAGAADGLQVATSLVPMLVSHYRSRMTTRFVTQYGPSVQGGVFPGMVLPDEVSVVWGDGDKLPKLLGSYEAELHPILDKAFAREPAIVINVGCAEGYYAVGAAMRQQAAHVYALDINDTARRVCAEAAALNGMSARVSVCEKCSLDDIAALVHPEIPTLLILDCEGAEIKLLRSDLAPLLASADLVVECHDFIKRETSRRLAEHFAATHDVEVIREGSRAPVMHPFLNELTGLERAIATCEFRPEAMTWLFCASVDR